MSKSAPENETVFRMFKNGREMKPEEMPVQLSANGQLIRGFDFDFVYEDGSVRHMLGNASPFFDEEGKPRGSVAAFLDITEIKRTEQERELSVELLKIGSESTSTRDLAKSATKFFQKHSGCEAVGIRLRSGNDYPYFETRGFPEEFVLAENSLCAKDCDGRTVFDITGNPVLDCMCGNVICSRYDASQVFFTQHGSFWTNCTTDLLASTCEEKRQVRTRNRCNGEGYESVALIALHVGDERLGLLQLNDHRKGMFTSENILLWERLADYLAVSLSKLQAEEQLSKYQLLSANSQDIMLFVRQDGRIIEANDAATVSYGYTHDEFLGMTIFDIRGSEPVKSVTEQMNVADSDGILIQTTHRRKDGSLFNVEVSSRGTILDGQRILLSIIRDITDRVEIEQYKEDLYQRERHIAEVLQGTLVPQELPSELYGCNLAVKYQPALKEAEIGGDFFDVFDLENGKIGVIIGDVAGKGLKAAVRVAEARYSIRSYAYEDPSPARVLMRTNEILCKSSYDEASMLTTFFAIIDTTSNIVTYANAGHEPPVVIGADCSWQELITTGLPLGVIAGASYTEEECKLKSGDRIVMITDGISEARSADVVLFEKRGVIEYLVDNCNANMSDMISGLLAVATEHAGGSLQDDAALVVFECKC